VRKDGEEKESKVRSSSSSPQCTPCVAQRARASYGADKPRVRCCMRQPVVVFTSGAKKSRPLTQDSPSPTAVGNPAPPTDPRLVVQHRLVAKSRLPREGERGQKTHPKHRMFPALFCSVKARSSVAESCWRLHGSDTLPAGAGNMSRSAASEQREHERRGGLRSGRLLPLRPLDSAELASLS
jgi:hypothetical protein